MLAGVREVLQKEVPGPFGADEVGIGHPDDVDALGGQLFHATTDGCGVGCAHRWLLGGNGCPGAVGSGGSG
ncbi:hypothetical protein GCM10023347_20020 [Streptomyces chumphonensis]